MSRVSTRTLALASSVAALSMTLSACSLLGGNTSAFNVEHGPDGPVVAALETHGVTTKNPATHARKASKKH